MKAVRIPWVATVYGPLRGQYQAKRVAARRAGSSYAYDLPGATLGVSWKWGYQCG